MENQIPVEPVATQQVITEQPKPNNFLTVLLTILLILSIAIAGFFAFQTRNLAKELAVLKTESLVTVEPTVAPMATNDPTADWEVYLNTENGYSIKFPKTGYVRLGCLNEELLLQRYDGVNRPQLAMVDCPRDSRYDLETKTYSSVQKEPEKTKYYDIIEKNVQIGGVLGKLYTFTFTEIEDGPYPKWYAKALVNKNNKTYEIYFSDKVNLDLFDQIISTFEFVP